MKLKRLVLKQHISPADLVRKKAQKWILGGYGNCCQGLVISNSGAFAQVVRVDVIQFMRPQYMKHSIEEVHFAG